MMVLRTQWIREVASLR